MTILPVIPPPETAGAIDTSLNISLEVISKLPGRLFFSIGSDYGLIGSGYGLNGNIWLINNGRPPQLLIANAVYPIPSPQGDKLVFSGQTQIDVNREDDITMSLLRNTAWVTDLTCSPESGLCQASEELLTLSLSAVDMSWSPDGTRVAFTTAGNDGKIWRSDKLFLADVQTGVVHTLLEKDGADPEFSPDGQWIMMQAAELGYYHGFLSLVAVDGSQHRVLYRMFEDDVVGWFPDWLPDNNISLTLMKSREEINGQQYLIPVEGEPTLVGNYPDAPHEFLFSPDKSRVIYRAKDEAGWLHFADTDGSNIVTIPGTDQTFHIVSWSPDGHHVVLCRSDATFVRARPCDARTLAPNFIVSDAPEAVTAVTPMDDHFRFWVDSDSYLAVSSPDSPMVEVKRIWIDGHSDFLFNLASSDIPTLQYLPE
jgi:dipeptidyl aminopeptidase/acylaminoacyl peptidase